MDPLTRTVRPFKWRRNRKPLSQEIKTTYRLLTITLGVMLMLVSGTFLYMNSLQPAKGYQLKQLQLDYESLQSTLRKWERKVVEAQSFLNIEANDLLEEMDEVNTEDLSYWNDSTTAQNTEP